MRRYSSPYTSIASVNQLAKWSQGHGTKGPALMVRPYASGLTSRRREPLNPVLSTLVLWLVRAGSVKTHREHHSCGSALNSPLTRIYFSRGRASSQLAIRSGANVATNDLHRSPALARLVSRVYTNYGPNHFDWKITII